MKKLVGSTVAGVCGTAMIIGGMTLAQTPAHADGNCHAYGVTTASANRAITAACDEVARGTPYSWAGGHQAKPGPSTGVIHERGDARFDDRNRVGLDCSGLVRWAWFQATGTDFGAGGTAVMPAELTAHGFIRTGGTIPTRPGDVLVYAGHTAIYLGAGLMVQAANHDAGLNVAGLSSEPRPVTGVFRYVGGPKPQPTPEQQPTHAALPKPEPAPTTRPAVKPNTKPTTRPKTKPTTKPGAKPRTRTTGPTYQSVRADAPTYLVPVGWHQVGVLHRGKRHFACQVLSVGHSYRGTHSNWWLRTDDTSGNQNVWVSATYLSGGVTGGRVAGVPTC